MAEKKKGTSPSANSKEKTSLLDLDIGKDFLTSWKSMSMTEDDPMDFDFSTVAKGKKKTFNFDNADMDFTLDGDFGKLSSFKLDMSDLDVSSPLKKSGKPKNMSGEVLADGKSQGKSDRFSFPFDFNEFDTLSFGLGSTKKDEQSNKNQDAEKSSSRSGSQNSGIHLNKSIGALEDDMFPKHGASEVETTSKLDNQLGSKPDASNKDEPRKDIVGKLGTRTSPEKLIQSRIQETDQETGLPEKIMSPESDACETRQAVSVQSGSGNVSTKDAVSDLQEEVGSLAEEVTNPGGEQDLIVKQNEFGSYYDNDQLDNFPPDMTCSQSNNGEKRKFEGDNHVQMGCEHDAEPGEVDSQFEQTSNTSVSRELLHETEAARETLVSTSELIAFPLNSGSTGDKEMPDKERTTGVIKSKFFKRSDETKYQLQQSSLSQIKSTSFGSKSIANAQLKPAACEYEWKLDTKNGQSGSNLVALPMPLPRELPRCEPVQIRNQGSIKDFNTNRVGLNVENAGSNLTGISRLHDKDVTMRELVLNESKNNSKGLSKNNSKGLSTFSLSEQANKCASQHCPNPRLPVLGLKSIQNITNNSAEQSKISPLKAVGRTSDPSNLKSLRTIGPSHAPLKATLHKDIKSLGNAERSLDLKGNIESRTAQSADTKKQTSPSPTLKRKALEESTAYLLTMKPTKRLSSSPGEIRHSRESSLLIVEKQVCNNENLADANMENVFNNYQSPRLHTPPKVTMKEPETALATENDAIVEKAEACAKELEDICSMLKKKHEEAKEILVRAVVNSNNLLTLNHPIYDEKIRMIQKYAASLMSK